MEKIYADPMLGGIVFRKRKGIRKIMIKLLSIGNSFSRGGDPLKITKLIPYTMGETADPEI